MKFTYISLGMLALAVFLAITSFIDENFSAAVAWGLLVIADLTMATYHKQVIEMEKHHEITRQRLYDLQAYVHEKGL